MDLMQIKTDSDFQNAVVPEWRLLTFYTLSDGKVVKRFKDSNGNFGSL